MNNPGADIAIWVDSLATWQVIILFIFGIVVLPALSIFILSDIENDTN